MVTMFSWFQSQCEPVVYGKEKKSRVMDVQENKKESGKYMSGGSDGNQQEVRCVTRCTSVKFDDLHPLIHKRQRGERLGIRLNMRAAKAINQHPKAILATYSQLPNLHLFTTNQFSCENREVISFLHTWFFVAR